MPWLATTNRLMQIGMSGHEATVLGFLARFPESDIAHTAALKLTGHAAQVAMAMRKEFGGHSNEDIYHRAARTIIAWAAWRPQGRK